MDTDAKNERFTIEKKISQKDYKNLGKSVLVEPSQQTPYKGDSPFKRMFQFFFE